MCVCVCTAVIPIAGPCPPQTSRPRGQRGSEFRTAKEFVLPIAALTPQHRPPFNCPHLPAIAMLTGLVARRRKPAMKRCSNPYTTDEEQSEEVTQSTPQALPAGSATAHANTISSGGVAPPFLGASLCELSNPIGALAENEISLSVQPGTNLGRCRLKSSQNQLSGSSLCGENLSRRAATGQRPTAPLDPARDHGSRPLTGSQGACVTKLGCSIPPCWLLVI